MTTFKRILLILMALLLMPMLVQAESKKFLQAKQALNRGQLEEFFSLRDEMEDHPLFPYLDYYYINSRFKTIDDAIIEQYIHTYSQTPMADKLRTKWLTEFADNKQWDDFLQFYKPTKKVTLLCDYLMALHQTGR